MKSRVKCDIFQQKIGSWSSKMTEIFFKADARGRVGVVAVAWVWVRVCGRGCLWVQLWVWASASVRAWAGAGPRACRCVAVKF